MSHLFVTLKRLNISVCIYLTSLVKFSGVAAIFVEYTISFET